MSRLQIKSIEKGIIAGVVATISVALSIPLLILMRQLFRLVPTVHVFTLLSAMSDAPASALLVGWVIYFIIGGVVLGGGFALAQALVPGPPVQRGLEYAVGLWLMLMMVVLPIVGAGPFASRLGPTTGLVVLGMTLGAQLIFGVVLGGVYGGLLQWGDPRSG